MKKRKGQKGKSSWMCLPKGKLPCGPVLWWRYRGQHNTTAFSQEDEARRRISSTCLRLAGRAHSGPFRRAVRQNQVRGRCLAWCSWLPFSSKAATNAGGLCPCHAPLLHSSQQTLGFPSTAQKTSISISQSTDEITWGGKKKKKKKEKMNQPWVGSNVWDPRGQGAFKQESTQAWLCLP